MSLLGSIGRIQLNSPTCHQDTFLSIELHETLQLLECFDLHITKSVVLGLLLWCWCWSSPRFWSLPPPRWMMMIGGNARIHHIDLQSQQLLGETSNFIHQAFGLIDGKCQVAHVGRIRLFRRKIIGAWLLFFGCCCCCCWWWWSHSAFFFFFFLVYVFFIRREVIGPVLHHGCCCCCCVRIYVLVFGCWYGSMLVVCTRCLSRALVKSLWLSQSIGC